MSGVVDLEPGGDMLSHPCELGTRGEGRSRPWQPPFSTQALCQSGHAPHPPTTLQAVKVNSLGKWKTALQMVAMTALLVLRHADLILGPGYESGERGPRGCGRESWDRAAQGNPRPETSTSRSWWQVPCAPEIGDYSPSPHNPSQGCTHWS